MKKTFEQLEKDVIAWAESLGIFEKSDPVSQMLKTASEVGELCDAVNKGRIEEAKLELGDVLVTLILQCKMNSFALRNIIVEDYVYTGGHKDVKHLALELLRCSSALSSDIQFFNTLCESDLEDTMNSCLYLAIHINSSLDECLQLAYDKISKRSGNMVNGVFVREELLEQALRQVYNR